MVKRQSPRILAASAMAALVVGLSACATPQTLVPYTPAEGVNADAQRLGVPANANEVPLKIRTLAIISERGANSGLLTGLLTAPPERSDQLVRIEGHTMTSDNTVGAPIAPVSANVDLPAGQSVILTQGAPLTLTSSGLVPGLLAELTLTFRDSEPQTLLVPIVDASRPAYANVTPGPGGTPTPSPTPAAPPEDQPPAEAQPAQ